jgi:hypothetical protein
LRKKGTVIKNTPTFATKTTSPVIVVFLIQRGP